MRTQIVSRMMAMPQLCGEAWNVRRMPRKKSIDVVERVGATGGDEEMQHVQMGHVTLSWAGRGPGRRR